MSVADLLASRLAPLVGAAGLGAAGATMSPDDAQAMPEASVILKSFKQPLEVLKNPTANDFKQILKENPDGVRLLKDNSGGDSYIWPAGNATHAQVADRLGIADEDDPNFYDKFDTELIKNNDGKIYSTELAKNTPQLYSEITDSPTSYSSISKYFKRPDSLPSLGISGGAAGALAAIQPKQAQASELDDPDMPYWYKPAMQAAQTAKQFADRTNDELNDSANFTQQQAATVGDPTSSLAARAKALGLGSLGFMGNEIAPFMAAGKMATEAYGDSPLYQTMSYQPEGGQMYGTK